MCARYTPADWAPAQRWEGKAFTLTYIKLKESGARGCMDQVKGLVSGKLPAKSIDSPNNSI